MAITINGRELVRYRSIHTVPASFDPNFAISPFLPLPSWFPNREIPLCVLCVSVVAKLECKG
jgi:hypothetical protein